MNERYLFKAKRIDNGEWEIGFITFHKTGKAFIKPIFGDERSSEEVDQSTICQCTGKRDKHNNLIFENDLMDGFIYPYLSGLDSEHDYFAEVCWCDDITGFGICTHKYKNSDVRGSADGDVDLIEDFDSSKWEVIGNIFDNPELLESEENMNNFKFESEFVEVNDQVLKIHCESENNSFSCLIDTYGDPYMIYYPLNVLNENEEESFREQIFDYLEKKYPEYF